MTLRLHFAPTGRAVMVYDDKARDVMDALGTATVRRASNVEPDVHGNWVADLRAVNGPATRPYRNRAFALRAEVEWLHAHLGEIA